MIVATFNTMTGWAGKTITYEEAERRFVLEDHGTITAHDVLSYDQQAQVDWARDDLREWVRGFADWEKHKRENVERMRMAFADATYLGGLPDQPNKRSGYLVFTASAITLSKKLTIPMSEVASIAVGSEQISKRKTGAVLAFGVLGGLAAKGTKERGDIALRLTDNREAYFYVDKKGAKEIRAALAPLLRELGIPFEDELADQSSSSASFSTADELAKLAQLRDQGLLTDEEFAAQKAKLLGSAV